MGLSENLKTLRKAKGFSQRVLSEKSHVSYSMVCKLESGEQKNPSLETLEKISSALDVEVSHLLDDEEIFTQFDILTDGIMEKIKEVQKSPATLVHERLSELLNSKEAITFFSINTEAISPDDYEDIEAAVLDYIKYQFSKFDGKPSIFSNKE